MQTPEQIAAELLAEEEEANKKKAAEEAKKEAKVYCCYTSARAMRTCLNFGMQFLQPPIIVHLLLCSVYAQSFGFSVQACICLLHQVTEQLVPPWHSGRHMHDALAWHAPSCVASLLIRSTGSEVVRLRLTWCPCRRRRRRSRRRRRRL
jgi:hypothetical protein